MKFLVVTPPSIYHGCSTRKTFWEENFTGKKEYFFEPVNMRNCDTLITILDLSMLPKIALATVSHVHRFKQILFLTCKLSLPERLPSGETMIHRRWSNN